MRLASRWLVLMILVAPSLNAQIDYNRADMLRIAPARLYGLPPWVEGLGLGSPEWMADSTRFQYAIKTPRGREFVIVDPVRGSRRLAFDNSRLAAALSVAADTSYDPAKLPFRSYRFLRNESAIGFAIGKRNYQCDLASYQCTKGDTVGTEPPDYAVRSPDDQWAATVRKGNLWIRRIAAPHDSVQLTTDGEAEFGYGLALPDQPAPDPDARRPQLAWSPDSRRIAIVKIDDRGVAKFPVYSSTAVVPKLFQYPAPVPSDTTVPTFEIHLIDVAAKTNVLVKGVKPTADVFGWTATDMIQWGPKSDRIYFVSPKRANKGVTLMTADAATGTTRTLFADSTATFIENASGVATGNWRAIGDDDIFWWSERDGWGHLYRYDANGRLKNRVTSGPWLVDRVKHIDPVAKQIYFSAFGRDANQPYFAHTLRVGFDGSGLVDLTPEPGLHFTSFVPSGKYFVDVLTRPDLPGVTTLRSNLDGKKLLDVETADPSEMLKLGWTPPRPFTVKARDGVTDLYGFLYLPTHLDTTKRYPVIVHIYPGPQIGTLVNFGYQLSGERQGLAELGFAVVEVNALGTPGRSKAFHDAYYGNMGDNGIADQIAATKQLAARYRFMDLDRVGIYGHSGGGFSSTGAILRFPDFFKVAVSGSGNHDNRSYRFDWGEKYQGPFKKDSTTGKDNFESQANYLLAGNLKGHLLLMHGDMDTNVHPTQTLRLVDALIKAGKDFDMLIVPDAGHGLPPYTIKKRWDYFVRWLMGGTPDLGYHLMACDEFACTF